jgi:hypothetical protein
LQTSGNPLGQWISNISAFVQPAFACSLPAHPERCVLGNLGRNSVYGPGFTNLDLSLAKNTKITEKINFQFRVDAFDLANHPNYGQPGPQGGGSLAVVLPATGAIPSTFSGITSTRFPTGDSGSSRQLQLALKLQF